MNRTPTLFLTLFVGLALTAVAPRLFSQDAEIEAKVAELHPIPEFPPIGKLLTDWTNIPAPVFPREVRMARDMPTTGPGMKKDEKWLAVAWENPVLYLARTPESEHRYAVSLDDTNMKQVMSDLYDDWSAKLVRSIEGRRDDERRKLLAAKPATNTQQPRAALAVMSSSNDPRMAPMVTSIKSGDYPELSKAQISAWHWIGKETVEGEAYETGTVSYEVQTIFGKIGTRAKALIKDGKVQKWIYAGTGEPVTPK